MNLRELKDRAAGLYARRRFREAAEAYSRIIEYAPRDPRMYLKHAEACRRIGAVQAALASCRSAARLYQETGQRVCARATLRVALEIDPSNPRVLEDLRRLEADLAGPRITPVEVGLSA